MRANVCLLDVFTGTVAEKLLLDQRYQRLSIRHVDVNSQKVVGLAMQFEVTRLQMSLWLRFGGAVGR